MFKWYNITELPCATRIDSIFSYPNKIWHYCVIWNLHWLNRLLRQGLAPWLDCNPSVKNGKAELCICVETHRLRNVLWDGTWMPIEWLLCVLSLKYSFLNSSLTKQFTSQKMKRHNTKMIHKLSIIFTHYVCNDMELYKQHKKSSLSSYDADAPDWSLLCLIFAYRVCPGYSSNPPYGWILWSRILLDSYCNLFSWKVINKTHLDSNNLQSSTLLHLKWLASSRSTEYSHVRNLG